MMENEPKRIQRKRTRGWRLSEATANPNGAIIVDRTSRWGNPYRIGGEAENAAHAVELFRDRLKWELIKIPDGLEPLRGKDLVCFCPLDAPCHADVLLELANRPRKQSNDKP